jgi:small-conductance mechanosensitive channel
VDRRRLGVLMIIFRPYKLGDLVTVAGTEGFVEFE